MAESVETGPSVLHNPLDIEQSRSKAQNQWLPHREICQILQNHKGFHITSEPHDKPPSGSLFLFDRKMQKHFRNDGHNWTKKKDGKQLLEGHQTLKVGSFGDLDCYYAHGEKNRKFQRRSYWMREGDFSHIVLVHYLEETGKSEDFSCVKENQVSGPYSRGQGSVEIMPNSNIHSYMYPGSHLNDCQVTENTDPKQLNCAQALEHESAQSVDIEYSHQPNSGLHSGPELQQPAVKNIEAGGSDPYDSLSDIDLPPTRLDKGKSDDDAELGRDLWTNLHSMPWRDIYAVCHKSNQDQLLLSSPHCDIMGTFFSNSVVKRLDFGNLQIQKESKASVEGSSSLSESACEPTSRFHEQEVNHLEQEANLFLPFYKILSSGSRATNPVTSSSEDASQLSSKISSLLKGDNKELDQMLKTGSGTEFSSEKLKDQLLQKHLKEKLRVWILQKIAEGGNGPSILDEDGQGVLHLAAALGYDWALEPIIVAGVSVDLRDVNGWTALHWAAFCGREQAVASLISLGAAPGALTERSPEYPSGRTPTDLASVNGHKRIAGYLADRPLDVHIPSINLDHQDGDAGPKAVRKFSEISAAPLSLENASDGQSQKDLSATSLGSPWEPVGSLGEPRSGLSLPSSPPPSQPLAKCPRRWVRSGYCRFCSGW